MKSFTDLEQSKKLAEILPTESADMFYRNNGIDVKLMWEHNARNVKYPCWSLAALTNVMRLDYYIVRTLDILTHKFTYSIHAGYFDIETDEYDELIDACIEMVLKLKQRDLL